MQPCQRAACCRVKGRAVRLNCQFKTIKSISTVYKIIRNINTWLPVNISLTSSHCFTSGGWNVRRLTKILSWNVTKWNLFFDIVPFVGHTSSIDVLVLGPHWSETSSTADIMYSYKLSAHFGILALCVCTPCSGFELESPFHFLRQ